jgi:hypothetical protein
MAWSQGSSKYQKQKKCLVLKFVYIMPKETIIFQIQIKKRENGYNLKIGH